MGDEDIQTSAPQERHEHPRPRHAPPGVGPDYDGTPAYDRLERAIEDLIRCDHGDDVSGSGARQSPGAERHGATVGVGKSILVETGGQVAVDVDRSGMLRKGHVERPCATMRSRRAS